MAGQTTYWALVARWLTAGLAMAAVALATVRESCAVVVISDGFGDADRDNNGSVEFYDTDLNFSNTWNDATQDAGLNSRGIFEVTAATDPTDVGIVWSGIRSFDTAANIAKSSVKIINDSVATGSETVSEIHNHGLALGVESRGGGSSFIGRFSQPVDLGPMAGDKLIASVDFRAWKEAANAFTPPAVNELRWGLYEDTDNELGMSANQGSGGASVVWGRDDGNWFANPIGAEGDKGIYYRAEFGGFADPLNARINWEYNLAGINGTSNNGRIFEGSGVSNDPGLGGDTATVASPVTVGDGPGGIIQGDTFAPHTLKIEMVRLANGLVEVATFIDGTEMLRDDIKDTDTGYNVLSPPPFSFDYVGFRNTADFDYVIDNFQVELIGSNEPTGLPGDYNDDDKVDAADYTVWRDNLGSPTSLPNDSTPGVTNDDFDVWKQNFGDSLPGGGAVGQSAVPEPASVVLLLAAIAACGVGRRRRSSFNVQGYRALS